MTPIISVIENYLKIIPTKLMLISVSFHTLWLKPHIQEQLITKQWVRQKQSHSKVTYE